MQQSTLGETQKKESDSSTYKIYLIQLFSAADRCDYMLQQFSNLGLNPHRIEAVDGSEFPSAYDTPFSIDIGAFNAIYKNRNGAGPKLGEIGCYFSHMHCLEAIVQGEADYAVVMEDDVRMWGTKEEIEEKIRSAAEDNGDFDLMYMGNPLMWFGHHYQGVKYTGENKADGEINKEFIATAKHPVRLKNALLGTQCYMISKNFAYDVLNDFKTMCRPIDELYRSICAQNSRLRVFLHAPQHQWWCAPNFDFESIIAH